MASQQWVTVLGSAPVYSGPCLLQHIVMTPDANQDYAIIYDGRDPTVGKKFTRVENSTSTTKHINLHPGVSFDTGIYIEGKDSAVLTTVVFTPLP